MEFAAGTERSQPEGEEWEDAGRAATTTGIRNHAALLTHGRTGPRSLALRLARTGLAACDPARAVDRIVSADADSVTVAGVRHSLPAGGRVILLGSGKASLTVAAALERVLGPRLDGGIIVTRDASGAVPRRVQVVRSAHPLPDERSQAAARALLEAAAELGVDDLLIACFTGGSSALTSLPPEGVPIEAKRELHRLLLASGMPISDVNVVRKQVSAFKGGRLAEAARPARVVNLTVSDVAGDALDAITDPTVPNRTSPQDAIAVLRGWQLWSAVAISVRDHLTDPRARAVDLNGIEIQSELLVTGEAACEAMRAEAAVAGAEAVVLGTGLEDEACSLGRILGQIAAESAEFGRPFKSPSVLLGCGGEATVRLGDGGRFGAGGPNREAALAAAQRISGHEIAAVFIDTDGSDGGGGAAGAIVDGDTLVRAAAASVDIRMALSSHRSGAAVEALGDAIETGPTHTNVNDLFAIAIGGQVDG